ncbi:MAG: putative metal-binding motif-containing protein, partial [Myxococcota bacterium]|nr:putative metal-binding motif-containing protein [Myxococcota bacterium]
MIPSRRKITRALPVVLLLALLFQVGCGDPNRALHIDKFTLQFRREASVTTVSETPVGDDDDSAGDGDDDDSAADDDDGEGLQVQTVTPGEPVQKRVTITNGFEAPILLSIYIDEDNPSAPNFAAFRIVTAQTEGLAEPYTHEIPGYARLEVDILFSGELFGERSGWNQARLVVEDEVSGYRKDIVLQGFVDCVSLDGDQDGDGFCRGIDGDELDCNDNPDTGFGINPGVEEECEDGEQIDNNCDGDKTVIRDEDADGWCDLAASCADTPEELEQACPAETDCNDDPEANGAELNPGQPEVCEPGDLDDQIDNDCDPSNDVEVVTVVWPDTDGDGWGAGDSSYVCGAAPQGFTTREGDCDDSDAGVSPDFNEICDGKDTDCDEALGPGEVDGDNDGVFPCETAADGVTPLDCDDNDPAQYIGHPEVCDGLDNDCDGNLLSVVEIDPQTGQSVTLALEIDGDSDGYIRCSNFVNNGVANLLGGDDCDDANPGINPSEVESACDGLDNDCNGFLHPLERDDDSDGFVECSGPDGDDCDDAAPWVNPAAAEICDGADSDCDGNLGDGLLGEADERDQDGDSHVACVEVEAGGNPGDPLFAYVSTSLLGFGDCNDSPTDPVAANIYSVAPELSDSYNDADGVFGPAGWRFVDNQCSGDPGYGEYCTDFQGSCTGSELDVDGDLVSEAQNDCDDTNPDVSPLLPEVCDGLDNNCDGVTPPSETDDDGDGYVECWPDPDVVMSPDPELEGGDCDDTDGAINPGAEETPSNPGVDNDCDSSTVDPTETDQDGDGVTEVGPDGVPGTADDDCDDNNSTVFPGNPELCDGLDNDCDGQLGDGSAGTPDELDQDADGYTVCADDDCADSAADLLAGGYSGSNGDVAAAAIHPDAVEFCDGWQNDCSNQNTFSFLPD